ncbi:MAG: hypothetical protein SFV32_13590 [Opitutaceae bacterium]|nr:hypothetical protein [Opitutaceae bacterium]
MPLRFATVAFLFHLAFTIFHYAGWWPNNPALLPSWIVTLLAVLATARLEDAAPPVIPWRWLALTALAMLCIHRIGIGDHRWNTMGFFDDAAWDIVFAQEHVGVPGVPFQAAFYDEIGAISRETLFHYYVFSFFALFGYDLETFMAAVLSLTALNILFTTLAVQRLVPWKYAGAVAFPVIALFPLLFGQTYMAHRYAVAMPLASGAFYFLLGAFQDKSCSRAALGGIFGGLCMAGAVMGKHVLAALVVGGLVILVIRRFRLEMAEWRLVLWAVGGATAALVPLGVYIGFHSDIYAVRESSLIHEFFESVRANGFPAITSRLQDVAELFFAPYTTDRQFLPGYPVVPFALLPFVVLGGYVAISRRHYALVLLMTLPILATFVSGAYDFRLLIAVPFWLMAAGLAVEWLILRWNGFARRAMVALVGLLLATTVVSSFRHIRECRQEDDPFWLLNSEGNAIARILQGIALGDPTPSPFGRADEFRPSVDPQDLPELFIAPGPCNAVAYAYLSFIPRNTRLRFTVGGPQSILTTQDLWRANKNALLEAPASDKDWLLAWETRPEALPVIEAFHRLAPGSTLRQREFDIPTGPVRVSSLRIPASAVPSFKEALQSFELGERNPGQP